MKRKPPLIDGEQPDIYDLDNSDHLNDLGFIPMQGEGISDMYCVYPNGMCVVLEFKSLSLRNAILQLRDTTLALQRIKKEVTRTITVGKMNRFEQRLYRRDPKTRQIISKITNKPIEIQMQNRKIKIELWKPEEIDDTYKTPRQTRLGGEN